MKTILTVALIVVLMSVIGCVGEKTAIQPAPIPVETPVETKIEKPLPEPETVDAILVAGSFWVEESDNMSFLSDALKRSDNEYLRQLILEKKVFLVDSNTKVALIKDELSGDNARIQFKEGRYTGKEGRTFSYNVLEDAEPLESHLSKTKQAPLQLVQSALASTENYFELIKAEDVAGMNQTLKFCKVVEKKLLKQTDNIQIDSTVRNCIKDAREIILTRGAAVLGGLKVVEYTQNPNDYQRNLAIETTYSFCKDELKLRQIFKSKYGY